MTEQTKPDRSAETRFIQEVGTMLASRAAIHTMDANRAPDFMVRAVAYGLFAAIATAAKPGQYDAALDESINLVKHMLGGIERGDITAETIERDVLMNGVKAIIGDVLTCEQEATDAR